MSETQLPLGDVSEREKSKYRIELLDYGETSVSVKNPRHDYDFSDESLAPLVAEIRSVGQAHDAIGEIGANGRVEILAGARRRRVCRILGRPLRVRIFDSLSAEQAIKIANREERGASPVSLWDKSVSWTRMLEAKIVSSEARLAEVVGEDKSAVNRALALHKAPAEILDLVTDKRAISMSQWALVAPLLEDKEKRAIALAAAAAMAGQRLGIAALAKKLTAAVAGKDEIRPVEVKNRHAKVIATILPDHRGAFTVRIKSMTEQHPSYRIDHAKIINAALLDVIKSWFPEA